MLIRLIKKLFCAMSLRGVSGVGDVRRGTVEEEIWSELGALPRSRRKMDREAIQSQGKRKLRAGPAEPEMGKKLPRSAASGLEPCMRERTLR